MRRCLEAEPDAQMRRHAPDAHWVCGKSKVYARCSAWWRKTPSLPGERVGVIGHYWALDEAGGRDILEHACRALRAQGCTLAVGPMDGSTWRRYRLITRRGEEPAFFMEPDNPDDWPEYFRRAGFTTLAAYSSALDSRLDQEDERLAEAEERLTRQGVALRPVDTERFDEELKGIYAAARVSFRNNFLYADIDEAEFLELYRPVLPAVRPGLTLLASQGKSTVGFIFAFPDMAQELRGEQASRIVIKTVAVLPGRQYAGLGTLLMGRVRFAARRMGFAGAIHALMNEHNSSKNWGAQGTRAIRRYELFSKSLSP